MVGVRRLLCGIEEAAVGVGFYGGVKVIYDDEERRVR